MVDINVLGARVLNRIISKLYHALIVTQKRYLLAFLELHPSLAKFASCKEFVHNKHSRQCIPFRQWTKLHYFASWRTKTLVIYQASGTLRMCFFYQICNQHNPNWNSQLIQI